MTSRTHTFATAFIVTMLGTDASALAQDSDHLDPLEPIAEAELMPPSSEASHEGLSPPRPSRMRIIQGEVLAANSFVRERAHRLDLEIVAGLATLTHQMTLRNEGDIPAEARMLVRAPTGSRLSSLEVCVEDRCRVGIHSEESDARRAYAAAALSEGSSGRPVAFVRPSPHRTDAFELWVSLIPAQGELRVSLQLVTRAPVHGGRQRLFLPARGTDPRLVESQVSWNGSPHPGLLLNQRPLPQSPASWALSPWEPAELLLPASRPAPTLWRFPWNGAPYIHAHLQAATSPLRPRHLIFLVDTSPSTLGPVRNRRLHTLAATLRAAPPGSVFSVIAFASQARVANPSPQPASGLPLTGLEELVTSSLGNRTDLLSTWPLIEAQLHQTPVPLRPVVILLGDGAIPASEENERFAVLIREAGLPVWVAQMGEESVWPLAREISGGRVLDLHHEAARHAEGLGPEPLIDRLHPLFADRTGGFPHVVQVRRPLSGARLRSGEDWVWQGPVAAATVRMRHEGTHITEASVPARFRQAVTSRLATEENPDIALVALDEHDLMTRQEPGGTEAPPMVSGVSAGGERPSLVESRDEAASWGHPAPDVPEYGLGVPAQTILDQLRNRVIPPSRACLRSDRRGRANYSVRATFHMELGRREVARSWITGDIQPELRSCLEGTLDNLDIPTFRGWIRVRYPIYTLTAEEAELEHQWDPAP